jgi:iron complex transport system ATP-binding protein
VKWLARNGAPPGTRMVEAARNAKIHGASGTARDVEADRAIVWHRAVPRVGGAYAWAAGEAAAVKEVRRVLVRERGFDRGALTATGYWRHDPALR